MDTVEQLLAIEEIKQLKARYQRALDTGDWDALEDCFTEDLAVVEDFLPDPITPRDAVLEAVKVGFEMFADSGGWKHWVTLPEIEITSDTTATGIWTYMMENRGPSWYEDRYRKDDGRWRIEWTHVHAGQPIEPGAREAKFAAAKAEWDAENSPSTPAAETR